MNAPVKIRKRPIVVEAYLYDGTNAIDVAHWAGPDGAWVTFDNQLVINTYDGEHICPVGHTVVRGTQGELYPIRPEVRADVYEPVGEGS